ncbi:MAG: UDP-N-acetylmuramate--L-alanine ligase [Acidimicrobiales bacterium]
MPDPSRTGTGEEEGPVDLVEPRRVHVVGIGGVGMSAIATVLAQMGHRVTGSDIRTSLATERLGGLGVAIHVGHHPDQVGGAEVVTASTAVPPTNVELVEAARRGVPVLRRAQILAAICAIRPTIAVAGTHGKTTTASMLALILAEAGLRPSFVIGGEVDETGAGGSWDAGGQWLVVEADESDGTFLELPARSAVVTSVEADHLDQYGSVAGLEDAFARFLGRVPATPVVCADDPGARRAAAACAVPAVTYGLSAGATYRMADVVTGRSSAAFDVVHDGTSLGRVSLAVPGLHNARNATAALALGMAAGAGFEEARRALRRYRGVARRFELRGELDGVTYVDDYGHLPGEVKDVLGAARAGGWGRIVAVFQPHRYSRTAALWADFADAFADADVVVVTDVYPAGEAPRPGVTGRLVADAVAGAHPGSDVRYHGGRRELVDALRALLRPGDLCLTLGAGDLTVVPGELLGQAGRR